MKKYFRNSNFLTGFILISFLIILFVLSFFDFFKDPYKTDAASALIMPNEEHLLGTDHLGRDVLARVIKAVQVDFFIGLTSVLVGGIFGVFLALLAGYFGGILDEILMRITDALISIPGTVLVLVIVSIIGRGLVQTIIAISILNLPMYVRLIRNRIISIKNRDYILWAKGMGSSDLRILFFHILPEILPNILMISAMRFSFAITIEAGLSYLGLGVQQPEPSLGNMLTRAQSSIMINPFTAFVPGIVIIIFVLGFNLLSDGLNAVYNEKVG